MRKQQDERVSAVPEGKRRLMCVTFLSVMIFGLVSQGMGLFNKFSYHDDIFSLFMAGTTIASGRWMLHVLEWLEVLLFGDGQFSLPLMNGLFSLLCIAGAACLLVDLLEIRRPGYCIALGCLMTAFPVVTGLFGYMYTIPYYMLAMLMMVGAAWLLCKGKAWWTWLLAILLGGCSVGIYQAFLPLLISVPLLYDISLLSGEKNGLRTFWKKAVVQALCAAGAMVFYFAANRFFLAKFDLQLNTYMGIDQMESTSFSVYLTRIGRAYREFFLPTRDESWCMYPMHVYYMYLVMLCVDALLALRLMIKAWQRQKGRAILLLVLFALMPLSCNFIFVMSEKVHSLMMYGEIAQFALLLRLLDGLEIEKEKLRRLFSGAVAVGLGLTCVMYARFDNQCYLKTTFQQQQAISWYTTLAARIKSTEGYRDDIPVVFLNGENISDKTLYNIGELDFIQLHPYVGTTQEYMNSYAWRSFMERWCGFGPAYGEEADWANLPEVRRMPHYPDDGSIRNLGDAIVVNF